MDNNNMEESCRRLVANDPTLTRLYVDVSWPVEIWKRVFYHDLPNNETVHEIMISNLQIHCRLPEEEQEHLAMMANAIREDANANNSHDEALRDGALSSSTITSPYSLAMNKLKQFYTGLAFAIEHTPKIDTVFMAGFDIVSSYGHVVQAMKRKCQVMNQRPTTPEKPFLFTCGLCSCHIMDHGVIQDLLASNILQSYFFHDDTFATPSSSMEQRFSWGLRTLATTGTTTPHLKKFMFHSASRPPPYYLMQDIRVLLQNHPNLEELNLRFEGREEDWWTLANALTTTASQEQSIQNPSTATTTTNNTPIPSPATTTTTKLQRLKLGMHGYISMDIIQAISFICCDKSTASIVKELDFSDGMFTYDSFELLTLVLSRVPRAVVDCLNLTEVTVDDEDDHDFRSSLYATMGAMLVRKLIVQGIGLNLDNWSSFSRGLALNPTLEYLDMSSNAIGTNELMALGRQFLAAHANRVNHTNGNSNGSHRGVGIGGLNELRLDGILAGDEGAEFMAQVVLQEATSLQALSIDNFGAAGLLAFARGIAHMPSLRKLTFGVFVTEYTAEFFTILLQSLQMNRTLVELNLEGLTPEHSKLASTYLPKVKYWLSINKAGRYLLARNEEDVSMGLWLSVLAKSSHDADAIFFLVQENTRLWPYLVS